jgi:hypothetical protein
MVEIVESCFVGKDDAVAGEDVVKYVVGMQVEGVEMAVDVVGYPTIMTKSETML